MRVPPRVHVNADVLFVSAVVCEVQTEQNTSVSLYFKAPLEGTKLVFAPARCVEILMPNYVRHFAVFL